MTLVIRDTPIGPSARARPAAVPVAVPSRLLHPFQWRRAMTRLERAHARRQHLAWQVQDILAALELVQYGHSLNCGSKGRNIYLPKVTAVQDGPPITLTVRMLPGQTLADYQQYASRLAENLGVARVRMSAWAPSMIRIELLATDPLERMIDQRPAALFSSADLLLLGVDDLDTRYRIAPAEMGHTVIQGQTGSGKSSFTYWLLAELCSAPDILIAGSDPTGLLLRPFTGSTHQPWQVHGTADPDAHVDLLRALVAEMDTRIALIPPATDHVRPDQGCPLIILVLEEYAGLLRAADDSTPSRRSARVAEIQRLVARLLAEGRKAAIRVVIIVQRADAAILGGFERGQCSMRISFRVDSGDAVVMLHPSGRTEAEQHAAAPPGIALLSAPGVVLARIRAPFLGEPAYPTYCDLITTRATRAAAA